MEITGEITYEKNGHFIWNIENFREMWEKCISLYSPNLTYSGREYFIGLERGSNTQIYAWFDCCTSAPPNSLYVEFQLRTDCNIVSKLSGNTLEYEGFTTGVSVDFTEYFSKESGTQLHDHLTVLCWVRELNSSGLLSDELRSDTSSEREFLEEEETNLESDTASENENSDEEETNSKSETSSKREFLEEEETNLESDTASENENSDEEETNSKTINKMLKDLKSLLASGENSDVTLVVGGREFHAHRIILCARSPVFKAMLCPDTSERDSGTVNIDDCDPDRFQDFLIYVYTGSTRHIVTGNVISLYATSDKYLMRELKKACVSFMKENMSVEGFCDITTLALRHEEKELVKSTTKFFCENSKEITETENWVTFLGKNPKEANEHFIKPLTSRL